MSFKCSLELEKEETEWIPCAVLKRKVEEMVLVELPTEILQMVEEYFNPTMYQLVQTFLALQTKWTITDTFRLFSTYFQPFPDDFFKPDSSLAARFDQVKNLDFWWMGCHMWLKSDKQRAVVDAGWPQFGDMFEYMNTFFAQVANHSCCPEPFSIEFVCQNPTKKRRFYE